MEGRREINTEQRSDSNGDERAGMEHTWVEVAVHGGCQRVVPEACPR
jgi:hypothetical protein